MGSQISRNDRSSGSSRYPPPPTVRPLPRAEAEPNFNTSGLEEPTLSDLNSYEDACHEDPDLRKLDENLQLRTRRTVNSIAVDLEVRSISLESLGEVTGCLLEMNKEVVEIILRNKKDIWKDPELSELVDDYFENSLLTLDFCKSLDACLNRARIIESIIKVALKKFEEEHHSGDGPVKSYSRTLEELRNFQAAGDPFTQEFFKGFDSIQSRQVLMLKKLQAKNKKLDKKLRRLKMWRKVSNVIFIVAFASVLIFSVVAAAITAPPVVTALAAAAAIPLGSMGKWLNSFWQKYEKELMVQRELISSMQIVGTLVLVDFQSIEKLVDRFQIKIEELSTYADFAMRDPESVEIVVGEIKTKVNDFIKTIHDLSERANKCSRETRMARTVILRKIISHSSSSNLDIGMF
ncbi:hypothetical protein F511_26122 [Dorcoceras hygrometricum]|uniref:Uncharacterized protein n=1 Tax=Dorcoceras hygrometricum TaxID=472368 RepID=A0A2Z7D6N4_9LAMI|nr:hypothetical protein F511_26122 [Dorcoceras hygrometricum]